MNHRGMRFHYHLIHVIVRPLFSSLFKFQVFGAENLPARGGVLLMSNHASFVDPVFLGAAVNRNLRYMARSTLFKPGLVDKFLRLMNAFPVQRGSADRAAIRRALKVLADDELLLIFPEGTRTVDGSLGKALPGIGLIAQKTEASVVPVYLSGSQDVLPRKAKMIRTAKVTVSFGKPLDMKPYRAGKPTKETYLSIGEEVMARIAELKNGLKNS